MDTYQSMAQSCAYVWEERFGDVIIGWANRDSHNTAQSVQHPTNILAIGESLGNYYNSTVGSPTTKQVQMPPYVAMTPLVSLTVEPTIAPAIYRNGEWVDTLPPDLWENPYRDINYVARVDRLSFEPIDLQWVTETISCGVIAPLAELFKNLDYMNLGTQINNVAVNHTRLNSACGFTSLGDSGDEWPTYGSSLSELIRFINTEIINVLNQYFWCYDLVPACWRLAGLLSRTWKEDPEPNNYTTLYTMKLGHFWKARYCPDGTDESDPKPYPDAIAGTFMLEPVDKETSLWGYARQIKENITFVVRDESFRNVTTTMQTVVNKSNTAEGSTKLKDGMTLSRAAFPYYPNSCRPVYLTYEPAMLVAIHNATIADVDVKSVASVADESNPWSENMLVQQINMKQGGSEERKVVRQLLRGKQPYDVPTAWSVTDDSSWQTQIIASMFKIMSFPEQDSSEVSISGKVAGREIITKATIYLPPDNYPSPADGRELRGYDVGTCIYYDNTAPMGQGPNAHVMRLIFGIASAGSFPLTPIISSSVSSSVFALMGYPTDLTHVSFITFRELESLKSQYLRNALGYPMILPPNCAIGTFDGLQAAGSLLGNKQTSNEEEIPAQPAQNEGGSSSSSDSTNTSKPWKYKNKKKNKSKSSGAKSGSSMSDASTDSEV